MRFATLLTISLLLFSAPLPLLSFRSIKQIEEKRPRYHSETTKKEQDVLYKGMGFKAKNPRSGEGFYQHKKTQLLKTTPTHSVAGRIALPLTSSSRTSTEYENLKAQVDFMPYRIAEERQKAAQKNRHAVRAKRMQKQAFSQKAKQKRSQHSRSNSSTSLSSQSN